LEFSFQGVFLLFESLEIRGKYSTFAKKRVMTSSVAQDKEHNIIRLIRDTVHQQEPNADIILYGSRARGDARRDSDWDVVVIIDKPDIKFSDRGTIDYLLWTKGLEIGAEINTLEYTRKQWDNLPPSLFKNNVLNEGIRL
jgi:predicted nucleotidyltransferase